MCGYIRSVAELGAVGRNLNQIARAIHQGLPQSAMLRLDSLPTMLKTETLTSRSSISSAMVGTDRPRAID
jgi:hypothetical protein